MAVIALLYGCGTITTVAQNDYQISSKLRKAKTRCETIPRVYSGVAFDLCMVHSDSTNMGRHLLYGFYLFDIIPSVIVDTIVIPYTIHSQNDSGSVDL